LLLNVKGTHKKSKGTVHVKFTMLLVLILLITQAFPWITRSRNDRGFLKVCIKKHIYPAGNEEKKIAPRGLSSEAMIASRFEPRSTGPEPVMIGPQVTQQSCVFALGLYTTGLNVFVEK
jgi:hypothetical protein